MTEYPATETEPAKTVTVTDLAKYERSYWVDQQIEGAAFSQGQDGVVSFTLTGQQSQGTVVIKALDAATEASRAIQEVAAKVP